MAKDLWLPLRMSEKDFKTISRELMHEQMHGPDIPYDELWNMMEALCKHIVYLENTLRKLHGVVEVVNVDKDSL